MKKIISLVMTVVLAVACLSFIGCNKTTYSYWQTQGGKDDQENHMYNVAELTFSSVKVSQVWINVSDLKPEETVIEIELGTSTSTTTTEKISARVTRTDISKSSEKQGWINVMNKTTARACTRVTVLVTDSLKFNEICLINEKGEQISLQFSKGGVRMDASENIYTKSELEKLAKNNIAYSEYPSYNIADEQDKFPMEYAKELKNA